jgi:uncharacterized protein YdiU (UPF0061 family)
MLLINQVTQDNSTMITSLDDLATFASYSLINSLDCDPNAKSNGVDHLPREVFSGHYVPVNPTPVRDPEYVYHCKRLFHELGFDQEMAQSADFIRMFSGDLSQVPNPMQKLGWACGYALSIYGREYYQQCPFQTGNGYGDGRAISVLEAVIKGRRWEMQLKGGGTTPYCRGADGRAVLRSSVREFLAQEYMYALGVPTSRSLSLYVSKTEKVRRPWYSEGTFSENPDVLSTEAVAITTRVASSFIRVGQIELFGRRARKNEHPKAMDELEKIVMHLIDREYGEVIDKKLPTPEKIICLASEFMDRLTSLVANWIRVGYCQGNFNSDNCAAGGFTLDYGPFGFSEVFDPHFQPWTGGGRHFSFMNQPVAAEQNFKMFCTALRPLLSASQEGMSQLREIQETFPKMMQEKMEMMWTAKLGLSKFEPELFKELEMLMRQTPVDYTVFFRELSKIPKSIDALKKSFYSEHDNKEMDARWLKWLTHWRTLIDEASLNSCDLISKKMKQVNPKYCLREWFLVPAYRQAAEGNYSLIRELNEVMTDPYGEQSKDVEEKYYRLKPPELFRIGGISHMSCSS